MFAVKLGGKDINKNTAALKSAVLFEVNMVNS